MRCDLTDPAGCGDCVCTIRDRPGLKGEGARGELTAFRLDVVTTDAVFRDGIFALLLTLAFGRTRGGDSEVGGGLNGDAGRCLS